MNIRSDFIFSPICRFSTLLSVFTLTCCFIGPGSAIASTETEDVPQRIQEWNQQAANRQERNNQRRNRENSENQKPVSSVNHRYKRQSGSSYYYGSGYFFGEACWNLHKDQKYRECKY